MVKKNLTGEIINLTEIKKNHQDIFNKYLGIFSNPIDFLILLLCSKEEKNITQLSKKTMVNRVDIWRHVKKLTEYKLITQKKEGREVLIKTTKKALVSFDLYHSTIKFMSEYIKKNKQEFENN